MTRRRRKVLIAVAVVAVFVGGLWAWSRIAERSLVERSRKVMIGQTIAEVAQILGHPQISAITSPGGIGGVSRTFYFGSPGKAQAIAVYSLIEHYVGIPAPGMDLDSWPVAVRFDSVGRVDWVKRGNDIFE